MVSIYHILSKKNRTEALLKSEVHQSFDELKIFNSKNNELNNLIINEITNLNKELSNIFGKIDPNVGLNIVIFEQLEELQKYGELENIGAFFDNNHNLIALE